MHISLLLIAAALFAVITGANDGASLLAFNLSSKALRPLTALAVLIVAVIVGPLVIGTAVATTFARGLVPFDVAGGDEALLLAVVTAVALIFVLSRLGLPASVTQALTGTIVGIGIGRGLPVDFAVVVRVIVVLVAAPIAAGALSLVVAAVLLRLRPRHSLRGHLRRLHLVSFGLQALAYAANDAQKMVAVAAVALGQVDTTVKAVWPVQIAIGLLFGAGTLIGVTRLGGRVSRLLPVRPLGAIAGGYASAAAVLASAAIGSPVSMAQASASALVGAEAVLVTYRRVRWEQAVRIASVWVTTLPSAILLAAIVGYVTKVW